MVSVEDHSLNIWFKIAILTFQVLFAGDLWAAGESIYGLESVKFTRVFDPDPRPERLLLVSGSLKLAGGYPRGNTWEAVTYVPQRTAAPRTDYGIFKVTGNFIRFYSFVSFATYRGRVNEEADRISITKIDGAGRSQTETWYLVR